MATTVKVFSDTETSQQSGLLHCRRPWGQSAIFDCWLLVGFLTLLVHSFMRCISNVFHVHVESLGRIMPWTSQCNFLPCGFLEKSAHSRWFKEDASGYIYGRVWILVKVCLSNAYSGWSGFWNQLTLSIEEICKCGLTSPSAFGLVQAPSYLGMDFT